MNGRRHSCVWGIGEIFNHGDTENKDTGSSLELMMVASISWNIYSDMLSALLYYSYILIPVLAKVPTIYYFTCVCFSLSALSDPSSQLLIVRLLADDLDGCANFGDNINLQNIWRRQFLETYLRFFFFKRQLGSITRSNIPHPGHTYRLYA